MKDISNLEFFSALILLSIPSVHVLLHEPRNVVSTLFLALRRFLSVFAPIMVPLYLLVAGAASWIFGEFTPVLPWLFTAYLVLAWVALALYVIVYRREVSLPDNTGG